MTLKENSVEYWNWAVYKLTEQQSAWSWFLGSSYEAFKPYSTLKLMHSNSVWVGRLFPWLPSVQTGHTDHRASEAFDVFTAGHSIQYTNLSAIAVSFLHPTSANRSNVSSSSLRCSRNASAPYCSSGPMPSYWLWKRVEHSLHTRTSH